MHMHTGRHTKDLNYNCMKTETHYMQQLQATACFHIPRVIQSRSVGSFSGKGENSKESELNTEQIIMPGVMKRFMKSSHVSKRRRLRKEEGG